MNSRNAGRKPNLNPNEDDRREVRERGKAFKKAQSELSDLQKTPPKHLDPIAKYAWMSISKELKKGNLLKQLDKTEFELFCMNYSICRKAWESIQKDGQIIKGKKNPAVNIFTDTSRVLKTLASDLGLNYISRENMIGFGNNEQEKTSSIAEIKQLFGG